MDSPGESRDRRNPKNAPNERFIWREGDLELLHDPHSEKRKGQDFRRIKIDKPKAADAK